jgi:hypothetical protein
VPAQTRGRGEEVGCSQESRTEEGGEKKGEGAATGQSPFNGRGGE